MNATLRFCARKGKLLIDWLTGWGGRDESGKEERAADGMGWGMGRRFRERGWGGSGDQGLLCSRMGEGRRINANEDETASAFRWEKKVIIMMLYSKEYVKKELLLQVYHR